MIDFSMRKIRPQLQNLGVCWKRVDEKESDYQFAVWIKGDKSNKFLRYARMDSEDLFQVGVNVAREYAIDLELRSRELHNKILGAIHEVIGV